MTAPSSGITAEVIRDIMPKYHLSADLLEATILTLPPPPADATSAWRRARITRLLREIAAYLPADAAQARIAAQILTARELAGTLATRAYAPELTVGEMCRLSRASDSMMRTATGLERALVRHQKLPTPFFGTVVEDEADIGALEAVWCGKPMQQSAAPAPASGTGRGALDPGAATGLGSEARRPGGEAASDDAARPPVHDVPRPPMREAACAVGDAVPAPARDAACATRDAMPAHVNEAASGTGDAAPAPLHDAAWAAAGDAATAPEPARGQPDAAPLAGDTHPLPVTMAVPSSRDAAAGPPRRFGSVDAARHIPVAAGSAANTHANTLGSGSGSGSGSRAGAGVVAEANG